MLNQIHWINYKHAEYNTCVANQIYRKVSNISGTKSTNLNDSRLVLQLSLSNLLKPGVKSPHQLHLSDQQFNYLLECTLY